MLPGPRTMNLSKKVVSIIGMFEFIISILKVSLYGLHLNQGMFWWPFDAHVLMGNPVHFFDCSFMDIKNILIVALSDFQDYCLVYSKFFLFIFILWLV